MDASGLEGTTLQHATLEKKKGENGESNRLKKKIEGREKKRIGPKIGRGVPVCSVVPEHN